MTVAKKILAVVFVLGFVIVGSLYIYLKSVDLEDIKPQIISRVTEITGRNLQITGPMELGMGFKTVLRFNGLALGNTGSGISPNFATVESAHAEVDLISLIKRELIINELELEGVRVWLERDQQGQPNWHLQADSLSPDMFPNSLPDDVHDSPIAINISSLALNNATISYQDYEQSPIQLNINVLRASLDEKYQKLDLSLDLQHESKLLKLTAEIDSFINLLDKKKCKVVSRWRLCRKRF